MKTYRTMVVQSSPKDVLARLGAKQGAHYDRMLPRAQTALNKITPSGRICQVDVQGMDGRVRLGDQVFISQDFARYMQGCSGALLLAATAGQALADERARQMEQGEADEAVLLNAAAAVATNDALDFMLRIWQTENSSRNLIPKKRRFSPGYGDLTLENQQKIYDMIQANELGISITPAYMLVPDMSVFAICGVKHAIR